MKHFTYKTSPPHRASNEPFFNKTPSVNQTETVQTKEDPFFSQNPQNAFFAKAVSPKGVTAIQRNPERDKEAEPKDKMQDNNEQPQAASKTHATDDSPTEDKTMDLKDEVEQNGREEVKLGTETHHVELKLKNGKVAVGIASEWEDSVNIKQTLLNVANDVNSPIHGSHAKINAMFALVEAANVACNDAFDTFKNMPNVTHSNRAHPYAKPKTKQELEQEKADNFIIKQERNDARRAHTIAKDYLIATAKQAIQDAWEEFGDVLPSRLLPRGAAFQDRTFTGNNLVDYHTGEEGDPIPIMWYKSPKDYPTVFFNGKQYNFNSKLTIQNTTFELADKNVPTTGGNFKLQKLAHDSDRGFQKTYNQLFNDNKVQVGHVVNNPLSEKGGYDGDHVKDLGFGGEDKANNYWPLHQNINRKAFNGYNSAYILNYLSKNQNNQLEGKARAIGGLIGKFFTIKEFHRDNSAIPPESNTAKAGTKAV